MKKSSPNYGKSPKIAKFSAGVAQTATCLLCHFLVALTALKVAQIETSSPIWQHWAKVLLPLIFSNLHDFGSKRDTTKEHETNSIDIYSIYRLDFVFETEIYI